MCKSEYFKNKVNEVFDSIQTGSSFFYYQRKMFLERFKGSIRGKL